ncbi:MAG TPA: hypothetical protein PKY59_08260 [Pyrinomonadaceae bacterium]|nr:hypothetical protein [Pyrinomonadaceae bacterium]
MTQNKENNDLLKPVSDLQTQIKPEVNEKIDKVELKAIEIRLDGVKEATRRSRFVFIVMTIVASAILFSLWNSYLSWDRSIAYLPRFISNEKDSRATYNQDLVKGQWIQNQVVSNGVLGIRVSSYDLSVVGSACLIVIMVWYFFSQRRENKTIVSLLRDVYKEYELKIIDKKVCETVYHGIAQSLVFINTGDGDEPLGGLLQQKQLTQEENFRIRLIKKIPLRTLLSYLVYLPPFTIGAIIFADIISLLIPSPLRECESILIVCLFQGKTIDIIVDLIKIVFFESIALLAFSYTRGVCDVCINFSRFTRETLDEFKEKTKIANEE